MGNTSLMIPGTAGRSQVSLRCPGASVLQLCLNSRQSSFLQKPICKLHSSCCFQGDELCNAERVCVLLKEIKNCQESQKRDLALK